jgi:hypothetical protein
VVERAAEDRRSAVRREWAAAEPLVRGAKQAQRVAVAGARQADPERAAPVAVGAPAAPVAVGALAAAAVELREIV